MDGDTEQTHHVIKSGKKIERNCSERMEMVGGTIKATTYGKIVPGDNRIKTESR